MLRAVREAPHAHDERLSRRAEYHRQQELTDELLLCAGSGKIGGGVVSSEQQIGNVLGRYADYIDTGRLEMAADLFSRARIKVSGAGGDGTVDSEGVLEVWRAWMIIYPDGTPRTKHVITNAIIEVDEQADFATSASYYTVFQQTEGFPLQPICAGRYHDEFRREDGLWHFVFRDYSLLDLVGDLSRHGSEEVRRQLGI
jgi:hypothetical protein